MPSPRAKQNPKEGNGLPTNGVDSLPSDLLELFSKSEAFQRLIRVDIDNAQLRERNTELEVTNKTNLHSIAAGTNKWSAEKAALERTLQEQTDEMQSLRGEQTKVEELERQLKEQDQDLRAQSEIAKNKAAEIRSLQASLVKIGKELEGERSGRTTVNNTLQMAQDDLARNRRDLADVKKSLATLESFAAPLKPLEAGKKDIHKALSHCFRQFHELYTTELSVDIATEAAPVGALEKLGISLPTSNSAAAKDMRIVAGIAVTGRALADHVFQQALVTQHDDLAWILDDLAIEHPTHEAHVRAVLLRLLKGLPEKRQLAIQTAKIDDAVDDIVETLEPWLPREAGLAGKVKPLCVKAAEAWNLALEMKSKIEPDFHIHVPADWRHVPPTRVEKKTAASGTANSSQNSKAQANTSNKQQPVAAQTQPLNQILTSKFQVAKVIWPVFIAPLPDDDAYELVSHGYVLTKEQMKEAEQEVSREESTYKQARQGLRRQSTAQKKRRNSVAM